jgi:hypothetical protein
MFSSAHKQNQGDRETYQSRDELQKRGKLDQDNIRRRRWGWEKPSVERTIDAYVRQCSHAGPRQSYPRRIVVLRESENLSAITRDTQSHDPWPDVRRAKRARRSSWWCAGVRTGVADPGDCAFAGARH